MSSGLKKTTIEGLVVPSASTVTAQRQLRNPAFELDLQRSVKMHWRLGLLVAAVIALGLIGFALTRPVVYKAESLLTVEPSTTKVLSDGTGGTYDPSRYESFLQQQMVVAGRADILRAAIEKMPAGTWRKPDETMAAAADRLQSAVKVERVGTSYQLSVNMTSPNPQLAATVVNAVTDAYLEQGRRDEQAQTAQRLNVLGQERARIQTELDANRAEQVRLGGQLGMANPTGDGGNPYDLQLMQMRGGVAAAQEARNVAAAQLASVAGASGTATQGLAATADEMIANDSGLSSMKATINQRKAVLAGQMAGLTPSNPIYKQDQDEIADLDRSLDQMATRLRGQAERRLEDKLRMDLARASDVQARLQGQLARQTATAVGASPRLQRAAELSAAIQRLSLRYASVDDAMRGLELEAAGPGAAHLALPASVPTSPEPSRRKLLLLAAIPLGLLGGIFAAVTARKRDPRIYTGGDLSDALGFAPIGLLPERSEVSAAVMDEYALRLAAGLQSAYRVSAARSFVFTGASPSMTIGGFIDDLRASLERLGFTATIVDAASILERVETPAGAPHAGFAAARIEQLKQGSDLLLIEAAPVLQSAVTESVVRSVDATVLVVECGLTTRDEVTRAALLLERLHVPGVGAVLQDLRLKYAGPEFRKAIALLESDAARTVRGRVRQEQAAPETRATPAGITQEAHVLHEEDVVEVAHPVTTAAEGFVEERFPSPAWKEDSLDAIVSAPQTIRMPEDATLGAGAIVAEPASSVQSAQSAPPEAAQGAAEGVFAVPGNIAHAAIAAGSATDAAEDLPRVTLSRPVRSSRAGVTSDVVQAVIRAVDSAEDQQQVEADLFPSTAVALAQERPEQERPEQRTGEPSPDKGSWWNKLFGGEAESGLMPDDAAAQGTRALTESEPVDLPSFRLPVEGTTPVNATVGSVNNEIGSQQPQTVEQIATREEIQPVEAVGSFEPDTVEASPREQVRAIEPQTPGQAEEDQKRAAATLELWSRGAVARETSRKKVDREIAEVVQPASASEQAEVAVNPLAASFADQQPQGDASEAAAPAEFAPATSDAQQATTEGDGELTVVAQQPAAAWSPDHASLDAPAVVLESNAPGEVMPVTEQGDPRFAVRQVPVRASLRRPASARPAAASPQDVPVEHVPVSNSEDPVRMPEAAPLLASQLEQPGSTGSSAEQAGSARSIPPAEDVAQPPAAASVAEAVDLPSRPVRATAPVEADAAGRWESGRKLRLERAASMGAPYARAANELESRRAALVQPAAQAADATTPRPAHAADETTSAQHDPGNNAPLTRRWELLSRFERAGRQVDVRSPFPARQAREDREDDVFDAYGTDIYKNTGSDGR